MTASNVIDFASLILNVAFLAFVLGLSGYFLNKFIKFSQQSRFDSKVNSAAELARARAYARASQKLA